jgi:hypothetical protein
MIETVCCVITDRLLEWRYAKSCHGPHDICLLYLSVLLSWLNSFFFFLFIFAISCQSLPFSQSLVRSCSFARPHLLTYVYPQPDPCHSRAENLFTTLNSYRLKAEVEYGKSVSKSKVSNVDGWWDSVSLMTLPALRRSFSDQPGTQATREHNGSFLAMQQIWIC